jgi:hypothetical protein
MKVKTIISIPDKDNTTWGDLIVSSTWGDNEYITIVIEGRERVVNVDYLKENKMENATETLVKTINSAIEKGVENLPGLTTTLISELGRYKLLQGSILLFISLVMLVVICFAIRKMMSKQYDLDDIEFVVMLVLICFVVIFAFGVIYSIKQITAGLFPLGYIMSMIVG